MNKKIILMILLLALSGCTGFPAVDSIYCANCRDSCSDEAVNLGPSPNISDTITIASFNIQVFGQTKAGKPEVMNVLAHTISRFDVVAIQEIRDKSGTAIEELEAAVDALGVDYEYVIGKRLGRSSIKEQYAFMYRTDTINVLETRDYRDWGDRFHREPFIGFFEAKNGNFDFVLINIHVDPDEATEEIHALIDVYGDVGMSMMYEEKDIFILGDLNADCNYFDEKTQKGELGTSSFEWLINDFDDTNLAKSECAYDRIIIPGMTHSQDYAWRSGVYRFDEAHNLSYDEAKKVSDHYPVWAEFFINKDTD
ncbi:deoxyribonuclease gamma (precursor) [Olavius sp. associated proteobacterium Delta 1]|nr:deoxyribonuclease gamma (precursor) [Olavius sp. associated proteobacterium Delta 1]